MATTIKKPFYFVPLLALFFFSYNIQALNFSYSVRKPGKTAYISPDMPCRLYFFLTDNDKVREGGKLWLGVDLPEGVKPVGLCIHRQETAADPADFGTPEKIDRKGKKYFRYLLPLPPAVYRDIFLYLTTDLPAGTETKMYYWGKDEKKETPEYSLPLQVINIHKCKHKPKRLIVGECWNSRGEFAAWPDFEKHYTSLGMNFIGLIDFDRPIDYEIKGMKSFVKNCMKNGIYVGAVYCPPRLMKPFIEKLPNVLARDINGNVWFRPGKSQHDTKYCICPSYHGDIFNQGMLEHLRKIAANGVSFAIFDYEFGFGKKHICFCERCLNKFRIFMKEKHPKLEYKDPRLFELRPEEFPDHHEAWRQFVSAHIANWFRLKKQALVEACKKYGAKSSPKVWLADYGSPGPWKQVESRLWYQPKNLKNGLDFVMPIYYTPWSITAARKKASDMREESGWRGFAYPAKDLLPWVTAGWTGGGGNTSPENLYYTLMEVLVNGRHGMVFYDGCGFDGKDFDVVSRIVDLFVPVEDIIIDGEHIIAKCEDPRAVAHGQQLKNQMVLMISEFSKEKKEFFITVPVTKKSELINMETGKKIGEISPGNNKFKVKLDEKRVLLVHIK